MYFLKIKLLKNKIAAFLSGFKIEMFQKKSKK